MKNLLRKEALLALHPTNVLFLFLSSMLLIPNYPYYVTFFYTTLGIFFLCLNGRENHDISFSICLPVRKREIVKARILFAVILESIQLLLAVPFAILRGRMTPAVNDVGMDANIALFGLTLLMFGIFNLSFFSIYYRQPAKVGKAFVISSTLVFLYIIDAEALAHISPFFRDQLDTPDPQFLAVKLIVLGLGSLGFVALTLLGYQRSVKHFEMLDL